MDSAAASSDLSSSFAGRVVNWDIAALPPFARLTCFGTRPPCNGAGTSGTVACRLETAEAADRFSTQVRRVIVGLDHEIYVRKVS